LGAALQADGETRSDNGLKHQKEKHSMDHFAGLDVSLAANRYGNAQPDQAGHADDRDRSMRSRIQLWFVLPTVKHTAERGPRIFRGVLTKPRSA